MELQDARKAVIYKVGRNVLLFQQMEHLLKFLVINGKASGHPSQLAASTEKRADSFMTKTLGKVVGEYFDGAEPSPPPDDLKEPHISFSFRMDYHTDKQEIIKALVEERNHLVHHFLLDIEAESVTSWMEAGQKLDSQSTKLETELSELRQVVKGFNEVRQELATFVLTDEFKKQFFSK